MTNDDAGRFDGPDTQEEAMSSAPVAANPEPPASADYIAGFRAGRDAERERAQASMTPSNPASGTNEAAERLRDRLPPWKGLHEEFDAVLATERAIGAAERELIGELVNALEWCDDRYRQTLAGKPVRDVAELRAYVGSTLTAARTRLASETPRPGGDTDAE